MKNEIIPKLPKPFVLDSIANAKLESWITLLKNVSPRILIIDHTNEAFNQKVEEVLKGFKNYFDAVTNEEEIKILNWPDENESAFILVIDSSLNSSIKRYSVSDTLIFCLKDFVFDVTDITLTRDNNYVYDLDDSCAIELMIWNNYLKFIKTRIEEIEASIPDLPKTP